MSTTIEQEMLNSFLLLNELEKSAVLQLIKTFIKSKEQSEIIAINTYHSNNNNEIQKADVVRYAANNSIEKKQDTYW